MQLGLKTNTEAIAQGRNPAQVPTTLWSEQVLEIQPVGATGGNIVWEWHAWDHLIQNYDNSKPNYNMNIGGNPQLINLNYNASTTDVDWIHFNSIDYNPALDQILLSSHGFSEVWVLDHSTTTAQAASHTGGNSGKGGDLLYRWGNPLAYSTGTVANRKFWGQHDARWIETGLPFANQIMVYNNGNGRTGGSYTTVEVINPPVSGFNYTSTTLPYLPTKQSWMYNSGNTYSYYAQNISGAQQLSNGNVLMTNGPAGTFTEVNTTGTTVWKYINPVKPTSIMTQGTTPSQNLVFKASFYPTNYSGFVGKTITTGTIIENSNTVSSTCSLVLDIDNNEINSTKLYPNPASETLNIEISAKFSFEKTQLKLVNNLGQIVFQTITNDSNFTLPVSNFSEGIYYLMISSDEVSEQYKVILVK